MVATRGIASEFELSSAASGYVVSVADLKDHLRYLSTDQDTLIAEYHDAAVARIESHTRRQLLTATWKLYLSAFPSCIEIRKSPVASISSITYLDSAGSSQTLATSYYDAFLQREPAEIREAYAQSWPATYEREQAVTVTFVAGYGAEADVPAQAKHAVRLLVEDMFWGTTKNEKAIDNLLSQLMWGL